MVNATATAATRKRARKINKSITFAVIGILIIGLVWWQYKKATSADPNPGKLITVKVTRGDLIESISATGSITAQTGAEVHVGSQITGTIKTLKADIGTHLKAGDPIAILDLPDLEAQVRQAKANLDAATTKLQQTRSGVDLEKTQTAQGIISAQAGVASAQARLDSANASMKLQAVTTPTDIKRADAAVGTAKAALATAQSSQKQVQASANLQIATAQESVTQNQATYNNAAINLKRNQELLTKGFVAGSIVDNAQEAATVALAQLTSAKQNVDLVKAAVEANLQSASDVVSQSKQNLDAMIAAQEAAQAEPFNDKVKIAAVNDAKQALDQAISLLKNAQANQVQDLLKQQDVTQGEEAVKSAKATYDYNMAQHDKSIIRSPIAGTVLNLAVQQGETLAAGLASPTVIVVADLDRLQVDAYVDETDIAKVKLGQEASIVIDAFPKRPFKGIVQKIASGSTIQQGVVTYDVTISISDKQHRLKPDMTASVTLQTGKLSNVLLVPSDAIKVSTKGSTVNIQTKVDGKIVITPHRVKTGGNDDANTEIKEGPNETVHEGDTVVRAGGDTAKGGFGPQSPFGPKSGGGGGGGGRNR